MSSLLQNERFRKGFIYGSIVTLIAQIISFVDYYIALRNFKNLPGISIDMLWCFGFPIPIFYGSQLNSLNQVNFKGLIVNLLIGITLSFVIGWIVEFAWSRNAKNED